MTEGERMCAAAQVMATVAQCLCEMQAMLAANIERERRGEALAYPEESFRQLPTQIGCDHNQTVEVLWR